tara:strand:+ start:5727 stop:6122 length:396 start_codon:yes stop_codon:yes gene_type:complete
MPAKSKLVYSDLNLTFARNPVTKRLSVLKDADAVKRALKNIILTDKLERPYKPLLGGNIRGLLFENFGPITSLQVKENIEVAIKNYEPRVKILDVRVDANEDQNTLEVTIEFFLRNQTNRNTTTISLERIR